MNAHGAIFDGQDVHYDTAANILAKLPLPGWIQAVSVHLGRLACRLPMVDTNQGVADDTLGVCHRK